MVVAWSRKSCLGLAKSKYFCVFDFIQGCGMQCGSKIPSFCF